MHPESGTTLRRDLTATAAEYYSRMVESVFIANKVAPIFRTPEQAGTYPIIKRENFLKTDDDKRAPDGRYNSIQGEFGSGNYDCEDHGLEVILDDARKRRYATFFDMETAMSHVLTHRLLMAQERRVAALVMSSTTFTANNAATTWATAASATPIVDIEAGINAINQKTGVPAEMISLICPKADFDLMCRTTEILNQVQYTYSANGGVRPGILKPFHIATVLGIKEVLVPHTAYDSTAEGETESLSAIWTVGKAMLAVLAEGEATPLEEPAAFRTMLWDVDSPEIPTIERYRDDSRRSDIERGRFNTDEVLTAEADLLTYYIDTRAAS